VDLVHVHFAYPAAGIHVRSLRGRFGAIDRRSCQRLPVVRSYYGSWAAEACVERGGIGLDHGARWMLEALSLQRSRRVIVLSEFSRSEVTRGFRVPSERVDLVPGGVDTERFQTGHRRGARLRLGLPLERPICLTVRRLVPRMGLDALLEAWARVVTAPIPGERGASPLLLIGGRGPEENALRARAARPDLAAHVHFLGFIPDAELPFYYQAADAYILPTRALEGFGLTTLEALACGLPVLGTPVAATPELLGAVEPGLILPGAGADEMAAGIRAFLGRPLPPTCAPSRLREFALRFSWERITAETLAVYVAALGSRPSHDNVGPCREPSAESREREKSKP
jgi:glycosyltransferase involved in cell wall biosynthesis